MKPAELPLTDFATEQFLAEAAVEARRRHAAIHIPQKFINTYSNNPAAFVHDCIVFPRDAAPTIYQSEILEEWPDRKRIALRGPHGLGKTALMAWSTLWGVLTAPDVKVPTTASSWRQLTKFLWPEIHKWARRLKWYMLGREPFSQYELQTLSLKLGPTREAFAVASNNSDLVEGAHADRVIYCYDEAKAIPVKTWDATEGAFASGDALALAVSTPGDSSGRFYEICSKKPGYADWWHRHVTLDEAIAAGRITQDWVDARRKQWGVDSPVFQARVLGEFPDQGDDSLIRLSWIEQAREQDFKPDPENKKMGVDVARFGSDDSVLMWADGDAVMGADIIHGQDTMTIAGRTKATKYPANIDTIGVGAGVYDRLQELGYDCYDVNVATSAINSEDYYNLRAEAYWNLREKFKDEEIDLSRLPQEVYDRLSGELTAIKYTYTSKGQIKIVPKETMKKELGWSPDLADALMLCYAVRRGGRLLMSDEQYVEE